MTTMDDIRAGVLRFREEIFPRRRLHFERLAAHQAPQILFIGCIDSRVNPAMLCHTDPGDMFVERTPGNLIPVYSSNRSGVSASIEFALTKFEISDIIVCGHSDCGALKALLAPPGSLQGVPAVERWMHYADKAIAHVNEHHAGLPPKKKLARLCEANVLAQIDNLKTHPSVKKRIAEKSIEIHGWTYNIGKGEVHRYDPARQKFALWPPKPR